MSQVGGASPPGLLHRAVSVVIFDGDNRTLLQRRAPGTYHFANRWSNTCCTHPRSGEDPLAAARRRLTEEMGMTLELTEVGIFLYRAEDPVSGLVKNEYDHVFVSTSPAPPGPMVVSSPIGPGQATQPSRVGSLVTPTLIPPGCRSCSRSLS